MKTMSVPNFLAVHSIDVEMAKAEKQKKTVSYEITETVRKPSVFM